MYQRGLNLNTISFLVIILIYAFQTVCYAQGSPKIYWTEADKIRRANLDGTNVEDVITDLVSPYDIALDLRNRKMYWVTRKYENIYRANLDGTDIESILNRDALLKDKEKRVPSPCSLAIDTQASKIYWGNIWGPWGIMRADIDGSNIEDFVIKPVDGAVFVPTVDAEKIKLDIKNNMIYFWDSFNDTLGRVNYDGSNYEHLYSTIDSLGLALDLHNNRMYWTHIISGKMKGASLDGDDHETILSDLSNPTDLEFDIHSNKIYWIELFHGQNKNMIKQANTDGTTVTSIYRSSNHIGGIVTIGVYGVSPDKHKLTTTWANVKSQ